MKTETLIELQRSITQGKWKANLAPGSFRAIDSFSDGMIAKASLIVTKTNSNKWQPDTVTTEANAKAITLVPELIAEVIRLREALRACVTQLDAETLGGEALDSARAALANDK